MRRLGALAALPLLAACIPPQGVDAADLAAFDAAVASVGCDLGSEAEYQPVELQTGIPRATLVEIAQYKVSIDQAVPLSNGGVRLTSGPCAPQAAAA